MPNLSIIANIPAEIPIWVILANLTLHGVVALIFAFLAVRFTLWAVKEGWRPGPDGEHWTVTARRLWPVRRAQAFAVSFSAVAMAVATSVGVSGHTLVPAHAHAVCAILGAVFGAHLAGGRARRVMQPLGRRSLGQRWVGCLCLSLVLYVVAIATLLFASLMPKGFDGRGAVWALAFAAVIWAAIRGGGLRLAAALGLAFRAQAELQQRVDLLARRIGHPPVRVYVLRTGMLNAFALPQMPAIGVTEALLEHLSASEVDAICAHEIGHLTESRRTQRVRSALVWLVYLIFVALYVMRAFDVGGTVQLGVVFGFVYLKMTLAGKFLRHQEHRADAVAKEHEEEEGAYARALEKLYRLSLIPAILPGAGKTHPHLYDRLLSSGVTPTFPRPEAPKNGRSRVAVFGLVVGAFAYCGAIFVGAAAFRAHAEVGAEERLARFAVSGFSFFGVSQMAHEAYMKDDFAAAARLFQAAARLDRKMASAHYGAAQALAQANQCQTAEAELDEGERVTKAKGARDESMTPEYAASVAILVARCRLAH